MNLLKAPLRLLVLFYQSLFLALGQIWSNKLRSVLTTIGIVIGVAAVTTVIAALTGLKKNVMSEFESFGTNKIFVFPRWPARMPRNASSGSRIRFRPELFDELLQQCPDIKAFTRITSRTLDVNYADKSVTGVEVAGIEPSWHQIEKRGLTLGRPFSLIDNEQARPVCLINQRLQDKLAMPRDCTGITMTIGGRQYTIIGVVEAGNDSAMFNDDSSGSEVYVPFNTLYQRISTNRRFASFMYVVAAAQSPPQSEEAKAEITFYLRKMRKIQPGDEDTFRAESIERFVQQFNDLAGAITIVATGIVGVSLLVGGVGIMNIMLVSVSERTREIGLRKAVGAKPRAILLQFLVEAVTLCLIGGIVGLLVGQLMTTALTKIPGAKLEQAFIPAWAVALAFGFAASVGVVFGMFPALKAARLDPIEALRHE